MNKKYKSKYTEHIMGAPAWSVVDNKGNVMAVFKTTAELDGEDKAKQLADEMNKVTMANIKKWRDEIWRAQRILNNLAVALVNMKDMITLKKEDLPGKYDPVGEYNRLYSTLGVLNKTVDKLPDEEDIEKVQEILSGSNK